MEKTISNQSARIHPHKFTLWVAMGSIVMMFAGLTSAYIVKKNQSSWLNFELPTIFWYSTLTIIMSSVTIHLAYEALKAREMPRYRQLVTVTMFLGVAFIIMQIAGFGQIQSRGISLVGSNSNPASSFLLVIAGLHLLHILGGIIALILLFAKAFNSKTKIYATTPLEVIATYWHFVDVLWIYLFVFFQIMH